MPGGPLWVLHLELHDGRTLEVGLTRDAPRLAARVRRAGVVAPIGG
jgi:hypothetical protein